MQCKPLFSFPLRVYQRSSITPKKKKGKKVSCRFFQVFSTSIFQISFIHNIKWIIQLEFEYLLSKLPAALIQDRCFIDFFFRAKSQMGKFSVTSETHIKGCPSLRILDEIYLHFSTLSGAIVLPWRSGVCETNSWLVLNCRYMR